MADDTTRSDDDVQHGIDDNPEGDATKGGVLGGIGGAIVGGLAGGPVGAVIGAVAGAVTSAAGVAAVDRVDNDNTVTGLGEGATTDVNAADDVDTTYVDTTRDVDTTYAGTSDTTYATTGSGTLGTGADLTPGNDVPGIQTGGRNADGTMDTRGITEKAADAVTGDRIDDKTGSPVSGGYSGSYNAGSTSGTYSSSTADDNIQHGIDDNPQGDAAKGAGLGAVGGAAVGFAAGGPVGAAVGAVAGGLGGGGATAAVDQVDNDNTVTGLGSGATTDVNADDTTYARTGADLTPGNNVPGIQTGGRNDDGTPDTRGITEKAADAVTGDRIDDKTGRPI